MTHEYTIALGGLIRVGAPDDHGLPAPTSIAWAADRVLAVGPDDVVRALSRGDSIFLDLAGCVVMAAADGVAGELEPGSPADLDFWDADPARRPAIVARLRGGSFTTGDEHCGPFRRFSSPGRGTPKADPQA